MRSTVFLFVLTISISSFAQGSKIKALEQQRKQALIEISNTDKLLQDTKKTTTTLLDRVKLIANQIFSRQKVLALLEQEVSGISTEQKRIEGEIVILEESLKEKQKNFAKVVDVMQRNRQRENKLLFVLSGKSLTESYRRMRYLREYSAWRSQQADEIKEQSDKLKDRRVALLKVRAEKITLMNLRESEQQNLKKEEVNYQLEVNEAQLKQKDLQNVLAQKRKQAQALDKQIARLIAEEVARQEREEKRKAEEKARAEAAKMRAEAAKSQKAEVAKSKGKTKTKTRKSKTTITKSDPTPVPPVQAVSSANVALSNDFASNKGRLPYPITGACKIVTRFGTHQHSKWNVTTSSNGIDIQSQAGSEAKAVFGGEVSYVAAIPGYNTCIIIRHGNYYTFYGNIQSIYVRQGEKVKTGQSLGKVYTDPDSGFSQIHFQLWQGTNKMNPEPWLR